MSEFSDKVKLQQIKNTFSSVGEKIEKDNNEQKANSKKTPNWNKNKNKKNKNKKNKNKNKQKT